MPKTNKISIYLIKDKYKKDEEILKNFQSLEKEDIQETGVFYYDASHINNPNWISKFFIGYIDNARSKIQTTGVKAIFIVHANNRIFAIPFGYGWHCLKEGVFEEKFGLKVAINSINETSIKKVTKKNISITPKDNQEQLAKFSGFGDFLFDIEQDLIQEITGLSSNEFFGKSITGKDSLHLSTKVDVSNIKTLCKECLTEYNSNRYKNKGFKWIDNIKAIKNRADIEKLDNQLINKINNKSFDKVWMAVPEVIDWSDVYFSYTKNKGRKQRNDINLQDFVEEHDMLDIKIIKKSVYGFSESSNNQIFSWQVYQCLYCEIIEDDKIFLLSNGKWYEIAENFVTKINTFYNEKITNQSDVELIYAKDSESEGKYNTRLAKSINAMNMDKKNIQIEGKSKIEFCDILTKNKELIHVKKYGNSALLGHLFNQGLVSAQTFLNDKEFRQKANQKINDTDYKLPEDDIRKIKEYKVVFAIISKFDKQLSIPFFSKVVMKNVFQTLDNNGFNVTIKQIKVEKQ